MILGSKRLERSLAGGALVGSGYGLLRLKRTSNARWSIAYDVDPIDGRGWSGLPRLSKWTTAFSETFAPAC